MIFSDHDFNYLHRSNEGIDQGPGTLMFESSWTLVCATNNPALVNPAGRASDAVIVWLLVARMRPAIADPSDDCAPEEHAPSNRAPQTNQERPALRAMKFSSSERVDTAVHYQLGLDSGLGPFAYSHLSSKPSEVNENAGIIGR